MKTKLLFTLIILINTKLFCQVEMASYKASQIISDKSYSIDLQSLYSEKYDKIYLYVDGSTKEAFLILRLEEREKIKLIINKFYEWARKADSAKIEAEKTIDFLACSGGFTYGSKHYFDFDVNVEFKFYSFKLEKGGYIRELAMIIPKMVASDNEYIDIDSRIIWIKEPDIKGFEMAISEETISNFKAKEALKQKKTDDILK